MRKSHLTNMVSSRLLVAIPQILLFHFITLHSLNTSYREHVQQVINDNLWEEGERCQDNKLVKYMRFIYYLWILTGQELPLIIRTRRWNTERVRNSPFGCWNWTEVFLCNKMIDKIFHCCLMPCQSHMGCFSF